MPPLGRSSTGCVHTELPSPSGRSLPPMSEAGEYHAVDGSLAIPAPRPSGRALSRSTSPFLRPRTATFRVATCHLPLLDNSFYYHHYTLRKTISRFFSITSAQGKGEAFFN